MKRLIVSMSLTLLLGCSPSRNASSPDLQDVPLRDTEQISVADCWQLAKKVSVAAYASAHRPIALAPEGSPTDATSPEGCVLSTLDTPDFGGAELVAAIRAADRDLVPGRPESVKGEHRVRSEVRRRKRIDA